MLGLYFYGNNSVKVGKKIYNLVDYGECYWMKDEGYYKILVFRKLLGKVSSWRYFMLLII